MSMMAQEYHVATPPDPPPPHASDRFYSLAAALDEIVEGAVLLNPDAQLLWHNRAFDSLLVENRAGHELVAAVIEMAADFFQNMDEMTDMPRREMARDATIGRLDHVLHCTLLPEGMLGPQGYLLCLVKRSASRWASYEERLRQLWGLTEREAQVAVECLRGKKNLEIADHLKISVETVNKHLDKVYQKAGVRGRSELASRLLDSAMS